MKLQTLYPFDFLCRAAVPPLDWELSSHWMILIVRIGQALETLPNS